jgi:hypothetical protein
MRSAVALVIFHVPPGNRRVGDGPESGGNIVRFNRRLWRTSLLLRAGPVSASVAFRAVL